MKTLVTFFVSLMVSSTVFAQANHCGAIAEALLGVQSQLAKDYATYDMATSSYARKVAVEELLLSVISAERAVEVTNSLGCLDYRKKDSAMNYTQYEKAKVKALNAEGSQNPVVRRAAATKVDLVYSIANLKE